MMLVLIAVMDIKNWTHLLIIFGSKIQILQFCSQKAKNAEKERIFRSGEM